MKKHPEYAGKVEVSYADHQNKADVATNKALEMIERDGVDAIFDTPNSACALAVAGVVKTRNAHFHRRGRRHQRAHQRAVQHPHLPLRLRQLDAGQRHREHWSPSEVGRLGS